MDLQQKRVAVAVGNYLSPTAFFNVKEFEAHYRLFSSARLLIRRFLRTGVVNEKLLINKIIIINNNFKRPFVCSNFKEIMSADEIGVLKSIDVFLSIYQKEFEHIDENRIFKDMLNDMKGRYYIGLD